MKSSIMSLPRARLVLKRARERLRPRAAEQVCGTSSATVKRGVACAGPMRRLQADSRDWASSRALLSAVMIW